MLQLFLDNFTEMRSFLSFPYFGLIKLVSPLAAQSFDKEGQYLALPRVNCLRTYYLDDRKRRGIRTHEVLDVSQVLNRCAATSVHRQTHLLYYQSASLSLITEYVRVGAYER